MTDFRDKARQMVEAGFSVLPCYADKRPAIPSWKDLQGRRMTPAEIDLYFRNTERLAIIAGDVSNNLEIMDFDEPAAFEPFVDLVREQSPTLPEKLVKIQTPSGGYHLIYRCSESVPGNMKLAMSKDGRQVRIETRGQGGYALTAPSDGYITLQGDLINTPIITLSERSILTNTAACFDLRQPDQDRKPAAATNSGNRPGDRFNAEHPMPELLARYGWPEYRRTTAGMGYTRPGKDRGCSGVLLAETGNLYVFSSSAAPLEPGQSYTPFALYTAYEHGGDFAAAARAIAAADRQSGADKGQSQAKGGPTERSVFSFATLSEVFAQPMTTIWLIKAFLEENCLSAIIADPESFKTFLVLSMAFAIATGTDWFGHKTQQRPVLYIAGEGHRGLSRRIKALFLHHNFKPQGVPISVSRSAGMVLDDIGAIIDAAMPIFQQSQNPPLVIVDTLSRNFGSGDESKTPDMVKFVSNLDMLRQSLGNCTVLVVHHSGIADKSRGRGSTAFKAALDFEYILKRSGAGQDTTVTLEPSKTKDHDRPAAMTFRPVTVGLGEVDEEGEQITSVVLELTENTGGTSKPTLSAPQRVALQGLQRLYSDNGGQPVPVKEWRQAAYTDGVSPTGTQKAKQAAFGRAVKGLVEQNLVGCRDDEFWPIIWDQLMEGNKVTCSPHVTFVPGT
jgi:hypothetical protein